MLDKTTTYTVKDGRQVFFSDVHRSWMLREDPWPSESVLTIEEAKAFVTQAGYQGSYRTFTSADGLIGVEIDLLGIWLRTREHPSDMWSPPEEMLNAGGSAKLTLDGEEPVFAG